MAVTLWKQCIIIIIIIIIIIVVKKITKKEGKGISSSNPA